MPYSKGTPQERFWRRVVKTDSCWLFTGAHNGKGYVIFYAGRRIYAHRYSWELHNGPVPDKQFVLHKCDVRNCVRPDHLFLGSNIDNVHDMIAKGRGVPTEIKRQIHRDAAPRGDQHWTRRKEFA